MRRIQGLLIDDEQNLTIHLARYIFALSHIAHCNRILDYGCGTGYGSSFIAKHLRSVDAYDISTQSIEAARLAYGEQKNLNFFSVDKFDEDSYDCVISFEVIEHMSNMDACKYLSRIQNLLRAGGIHISSTPRALPYAQRSRNRQEYHVHEYTYQEYRGILRQHFTHVFLFSQNDSIISTQNPKMAWNYLALCIK